MKVKSLSYDVEFKDNKFNIGCQSIDFDDAKEIALFINEQEFVKPKTPREELPNEFTVVVDIPESEEFRDLVHNALNKLGIQTHGVSDDPSQRNSFRSTHTHYNIAGEYYSGNRHVADEEVSLRELLKQASKVE